MSRKDQIETENMLSRLSNVLYKHMGAIADDAAAQCRADAEQLRRISMTLHHWHELECGTDVGAIERDEVTGKPYWSYSSGSADGKRWRHAIPDREQGALARLAKIMAKYPTLGHYVQDDPRGASLYILRPGDVPAGEPVDSYYSRGIAVYK